MFLDFGSISRLELSDEAIRAAQDWYYSIELRPGVVTPGANYPNVALTRAAIGRMDLAGTRCLDIGAMEGLVTTVLCRRGAAGVVGYDRWKHREKIAAVRHAYGAPFEYVDGIPLRELPSAFRRAGHGPFDVVVFSGVLYHLFDPLGGLATARALLRENGLMILETSSVITHEAAFLANVRKHMGGHSYLVPTIPAVEYFARFLRMRILDCEYILSHRVPASGLVVARLCLVLRATDDHTLDEDDPFMGERMYIASDTAEYVDWDWVRSDAPPVPYSAEPTVHRYETARSLEVLMTVLGNRPRPVAARDVTLHLADAG
jgi:2-polyprenyl-3-methyl-5-hydroxy-6-metoxy-1,4-benzoquinol methylase